MKMSDAVLQKIAAIEKQIAELKRRDVGKDGGGAEATPKPQENQGSSADAVSARGSDSEPGAPRKTKTGHRRIYPDEPRPDGTFAPLPDQNEWIDEFTRRGDEFKG